MSRQPTPLYEFGPFLLNPSERQLLRAGRPVSLPPRIFSLLLTLVRQSGHLVEKDELLRTVWEGSFVEEGNINRNISTLRRILGETPGAPRYIETVPKSGYRFVAPVQVHDAPHLAFASSPEARATAPAVVSERHARAVVEAAESAYEPMTAAHASVAVAPPPVTARRAFAVLPFKLTGTIETGNEYLEVGLADALITRLGALRQLVVRPTSAVARYSAPGTDILAAGRELGVSAVLDGRVQAAGGRIRVTVQLVSVAEGATLWAEKFDERWTDIFTVQDSISEQVARALVVNLSTRERQLLTEHGTENAAAFQAYLRGRHHWNRFVEDDLKRAVEFFKLAIELDPAYALAHCGVADCYNFIGLHGVIPPRMVFGKSKAAAARALEIDERLAEAHTSLAFVTYFYDWDFAGSEALFRRAIQLNPNYATAHHLFSFALNALGRFQEAAVEVRLAQEIDPLSSLINDALGFCYWNARLYERAEAMCLKTIARDPDFFMAHYGLAMTYAYTGRHEAGILEALTAARVSGNSPLALATLGYTYAAAGRRAEAEEVLAQLCEMSRRVYVPPYFLALVQLTLGRHDEAFAELERGIQSRDGWLTWIGVEPRVDALRADPRFPALLRRVGLPA